MLGPDQIRARLAKLGFWLQNVHLGHGIWTNPNDPRAYDPRKRWSLIEPWVPSSLSGKTVLDLGCGAGYFSIMMKKRGAHYVLGIDVAEKNINQAKFLAEMNQVDVDFRLMDAYSFCLTNKQIFDYVLLLGLFYHLRHPLLVLDHVSLMTRELIYLQSVIRGQPSRGELKVLDDYPGDERDVFNHEEFPRMFFIEKKYSNDPTNWWFPNESGMLAILRSAGLELVARPSEEVFVSRPARTKPVIKVCEHVSFPRDHKME